MARGGWVRTGGWAAFAVAAVSSLRVVAEVTVFQELYNPGHPPNVTPFAEYWGLAAIEAVALALAVAGLAQATGVADRVRRVGLAAGAIAVAMLFAGALLAISEQVHRGWGGRLAAFSSVPLGVWMLCVAAADWRRKRLPAFLRMVGAALGAVLMILPAVPFLRAFLVLGLVWWISLGVVLLRAPRSTPG